MQTQLSAKQPSRFVVEDDYEYILVVQPSDDVCTQVADEVERFYNTYQHKAALQLQPHIKLMRFFAKQDMEDTIIRYTHRITSTRQSFTVMLNNYSATPGTAIFIRVQQHGPFKQLADAFRAVDEYIQGSGYPAATRADKPHINIAKKLQQRIFNEAIFDYSQRIFNASFVVRELVLLKRRNHFEPFKMVNVFRLQDNEGARA